MTILATTLATPVLEATRADNLDPIDVQNRTNFLFRKEICTSRAKYIAPIAITGVVLLALSPVCPLLLIAGIFVLAIAAVLAILNARAVCATPPASKDTPILTTASLTSPLVTAEAENQN